MQSEVGANQIMKIERNIRSFQAFSERKANRHAVILAGGDGTRLRSLTRAIAGDERPKQFCPILGDETLLDKTRSRTAMRIAPENTHFSLTQKHEQYYERLLCNVSESQMIVQPENRGTAPAILYSLMRLAKTSPDARVAFFPSDHYFTDDTSFMNYVDSAFRTVEAEPGSIVLLGIEPEKAETSYGWIEPVQSLFGDLSKAVSRVSEVGWCDWGEPERVVGTLTDLGVQTEWMQALAA